MFIGRTRFSLYSPNSGAWVASNGSRLSEPEYLDYLYSPQRMDPRCEIFFNITLPMLAIASEGLLFRHIVSYSAIMPTQYQAQLEEAAARFPFLVLDRVDAGADGADVARLARDIMRAAGLPATTVFGSMRLDDDDALSADYFEQMAPYVTQAHVGFVVSLGRGVTALYEDGQLYYARDAVFPLHSKGHLSVCRFDGSGDLQAPLSAPHNWADRFNPVILDSREFSHLWVRSVTQDTALYQHGRGEGAQLARIRVDMDQYPALSVPVDAVFPVLAGKIYTASGPASVTR